MSEVLSTIFELLIAPSFANLNKTHSEAKLKKGEDCEPTTPKEKVHIIERQFPKSEVLSHFKELENNQKRIVKNSVY